MRDRRLMYRKAENTHTQKKKKGKRSWKDFRHPSVREKEQGRFERQTGCVYVCRGDCKQNKNVHMRREVDKKINKYIDMASQRDEEETTKRQKTKRSERRSSGERDRVQSSEGAGVGERESSTS